MLAGVMVAGGVGWAVDTTLLWLLHTRMGIPTALAAAIGFTASGIVNFSINRIVFHAQAASGRTQVIRFGATFAVNLALVSTLVPLLAHAFPSTMSDGVRVVLAKLLTTAALLPMNVIAYRRWVFLVDEPRALPDSPPAALQAPEH